MSLSVSVCAALLLVATPQTTWTVEASGAGQFTQVSAAEAVALDGDRILVGPGFYGPVSTSKRLEILGSPTGSQPWITSLTVDGARGFRLAGVRAGFVKLDDTRGTVVVDQCELFGSPSGESLQVTDCQAVLVSNSNLVGVTDDGFTSFAEQAALIRDSYVEFVDSELIGGEGYMPICIGCGETDGELGLDVRGSSTVVLTRTSVFGGFGGSILDSSSADAIVVRQSATVRARGSAAHYLGDAVTFDQAQLLYCGINAPFTSTAFGASTIAAIANEPHLVSELGATAPTVLTTGGSASPRTVTVELYGPAGTQLLLLASLPLDDPTQVLPLPTSASSLWIDLAATTYAGLRPANTASMDRAVTVEFVMPDLPGRELWIQGLEPTGAGLVLTNPSVVIAR